ncbi:MAG: S-ribosylhomocysteine lyase [Fusobacteriaceae bacterium]|jgi:S-ribosylhomocysteine lyase|nr:luxS [Fusobacteriales bacterium]MDN5303671.1 S-ribosylhomocysteine lyase [Fusobacteriaceae bacterium]
MDKTNVESFKLDHTKVKAPYLRIAKDLEYNGVKVRKFDLRFCQPNKEVMETGAIHAIEHIMAEQFNNPEYGIKEIIDFSPMGCRTGFYIIMFTEFDEKELLNKIKLYLKNLLDYNEIPAANEIQCGNYRDMDLKGAKEIVRKVIDNLELF